MAKQMTCINGVSLISDMDMVVRAYNTRGSFEPDSLAIWNELSKKRGVMLDIGAYSGIYSISAALRGSKAIAFEPNPHAAKRLFENVSINKVSVEIHNIAAWNIETKCMLRLKDNFLLSSASSLVEERKGRRFLVKAQPVDSFNFENVVAIKVDAERSERYVLEGAFATIKKFKPVLLIEELDTPMVTELIEMLAPVGYAREKLTQSMSVWRQV